MVDLFVLTTRGLEDISQREIADITGVSDTQIAYRRIRLNYDGDLRPLLTLRTVDDVFLTVDTRSGLTHTRQALIDLKTWLNTLDFLALVELLRQMRDIPAQPTFSVTANFVGKRNYSVPEIKTAIAESLPRYSDDDGTADINLRLFIEHDEALIGMRLGKHPLYRRPYKQAHLPGSLKPPVAAAMLLLAEIIPGQIMLDPFCGSGTILVEAALMGLHTIGGDAAAESLDFAYKNAREAAVNSRLYQSDATRLPLKDQSVDLTISNLPWGRQIQVETALARLYSASLAEMRRVTRGRLVLLTSEPQLLAAVEQYIIHQREISLFGQNPTIIVIQ